MHEFSAVAHDAWFRVVEIEVNSRCNRKCSYCPVSVVPTPTVNRLMSEALFDRIVSELVRISFRGRMSYHLFNEPLLRRDLEVLVAKVARHLPDVHQLLFTNGDLLSDERHLTLKQAGIDHFLVTRHDFTPIPERTDQKIQFPSSLTLVNRGGFFEPLMDPLVRPCYAPTDMLIVTVDGDVLLCCDDANRVHVMGNLVHQDLEDIWFSPEFVRTRQMLQAGNRREASSICRQCNNLEYFGPGENDNKHLRKNSGVRAKGGTRA